MANYERLPVQEPEQDAERKEETKSSTAVAAGDGGAPPQAAVPMGWPTDGVAVGNAVPQRSKWKSGIFSCVGGNDEFYSSDLEVCVLGGLAPCVLHGSNVERLGSAPGTFASHCLPYTGLYLVGNCCFGWNCLAPWYSYTNRTAIRRKFNLQGSYEAVVGCCGCSGNFLMDDLQREQCETACDFATHVFCHSCALCQEAREVRRRIPHPGALASEPILVMIPPVGQAVGRGGA